MKIRLRPHWVIGAALLLLYGPRFFPWLLAFPHHTSAGIFEVWSETPIDQAKLQAIAEDADRRLRDSPLYVPPEQRDVYLTQGSWRWQWLALSMTGAFAISPPVSDAVIVNRNSIDENAVWNGRTVGGRRTLAGILAHETCHGMVRRRFGLHSMWTTPIWLREGYCDHVAQESSLSDKDYAALMASGTSHPALPYYEGRKRAAAILQANGGDIDALFASAD